MKEHIGKKKLYSIVEKRSSYQMESYIKQAASFEEKINLLNSQIEVMREKILAVKKSFLEGDSARFDANFYRQYQDFVADIEDNIKSKEKIKFGLEVQHQECLKNATDEYNKSKLYQRVQEKTDNTCRQEWNKKENQEMNDLLVQHGGADS